MIGTEFVPTPDKGEIRIQFETPVDSSLEYTQAKLHQVDQIIRQFPDVVSTYGVVNSEVDSVKPCRFRVTLNQNKNVVQT